MIRKADCFLQGPSQQGSHPGIPDPDQVKTSNFPPAAAALPVALLLLGGGCARIISHAAGRALAPEGALFAAEDDPELVRQALPFGLKTLEGLLAQSPRDPALLLAAASGFTQYAYAFVQQDAEFLAAKDPAAVRAGLARARRLYLRARDYGLRGLEARHRGFGAALESGPAAAAALAGREDLPLLYWTAAAWGASVSLAKDDMKAVGQLPRVEALFARALALDEAWDHGALHEFAIAYEGAQGGRSGPAKAHLDRALALSGGRKLGPLVTYAESVCVPLQDRKSFDELLDRVLAFDADSAPPFRLANLVAQSRARWLKSRTEDLFL
jgi:predicted anti-sigma-YlaC factor YlaD